MVNPLTRIFLIMCTLLGLTPCLSARPGPEPTAPVTLCTQLQILIPLYVYPDPGNGLSQWQRVADASARAPITAIIGPSNGPGGGPPDSDYQAGLAVLAAGQVSTLGYVYTSSGARDAAQVRADVLLYHQYFGVSGIFFDEVAQTPDQIPYYRSLYTYTKSLSSTYKVVLNPGTNLDYGYFTAPAADTGVLFESYASEWPSYEPDPYVASDPSIHSAMMAHTAMTDTLASGIALARARHFGWVYFTDADFLPDPWDRLPVYWDAEVNIVAQANRCVSYAPLLSWGSAAGMR